MYTQECGWGEPPTPPSLPSFSPGSLTQTFCGPSPLFSPPLEWSGCRVACSGCSYGMRAPPRSRQGAAVSSPAAEARAEPSWPAAAGSHGQQHDWVLAEPPPCYSCSTKMEFPERISEQVHPWDISFGYGWAVPAGTPTYERFNRVSKLVSTSQLSYSSCAVLLIAKKWDGGNVALFFIGNN